MGRPRGFSEEVVLEGAAVVFVRGGYEGTSVDDLVTALQLHRGSLYKAFGSKRGLFLAVLRHCVETRLQRLVAAQGRPAITTEIPVHRTDLDLLLVAALERGPRDEEVAALVRRALALLEDATIAVSGPRQRSVESEHRPERALQLLGARLFDRLYDQANSDSSEPSQSKEN